VIDLTSLRCELGALDSLRAELAGVITGVDPRLELSLGGLRQQLGIDLGAVRRLERIGRIHPRRTSRRRRAWKRYSVREVLLALLVQAPRVPIQRRRRAVGGM
jgi:hypothetical protein